MDETNNTNRSHILTGSQTMASRFFFCFFAAAESDVFSLVGAVGC